MNREFEAVGTFLGQPARLKWRSGVVEGEPQAAIKAIRAVVRAGTAVGIAGHFAVRASLQTRRAAMATVAYVLDAPPPDSHLAESRRRPIRTRPSLADGLQRVP